ncbi:MAG: transglutaminase-like domain-containing protein [Magnetovibrio sp.]|nr:transglutaminase-like domain-containing protein [Magnetovibrio sp.]
MTPTPHHTSAHQALTDLAHQPEDQWDLARASLWLAKWAEPNLNIDVYDRHLISLVHDVRAYVANDTDDPYLIIEAAQQILARRYGYVGVTDPAERADGANMARTIDRRRGHAQTLAILYHLVIADFNQHVEIIDFQPRTLVAVQTRSERLLLDPVDGGRLLSARDLRQLLDRHAISDEPFNPMALTTMTPKSVLLSLQHLIKAHHLRYVAPEAALQAIEGALLFAPTEAKLWRELGLLHARLDHLLDATQALEHYLQLPSDDTHRYTASQMLQDLHRELERTKS